MFSAERKMAAQPLLYLERGGKHMRKQWKGFISGFVTAAMILVFVTSAYAAYQRQATLDYTGIKITLNGQPVTPADANGNPVEPFAMEGTTYLPVRAIANALGLGVEWEQATQTVKLTGGGALVSDQQAQVATEFYSRTNPAPIGTAQSIQVKTYSEDYNASVVVLEATRGDGAYKMLKEANEFWAQAPDEGMEYIVVKARVSINSVAEDKAVSLSSYSFDAYSADNVEYKSIFTVDPEPQFRGNVFAGGTLEGYFTIQVSQSDKAPKLVFGSKYDGSGGIWFSLV